MDDRKINNLDKKSHRCCFTGHRPEKLNMSEQEVKRRLKIAIKQAISNGFITFISGMARGVDMWAAQIVLEERKNNEQIHLICASPYNGFESRWEPSEQKQYNDILEQANHVKFVCKCYNRSCFQIRNQYMVDHSSLVIAVYNNMPGGTKNTIDYANKHGVSVKNIL